MADSLPASGSPLLMLFVLSGAALSILAAEHWRVHWRLSAWVALAALVVAPALSAIVVLSGQGGTLRGMIALGGDASIRALMASGAAAVVVLLDLGARRQERGTRYALLLFAVCGIVTVAQSQHLIPLVLGLAITHVALTALTGARTGWAGYGLSAVGLGAVLLAVALVYGATGSLHLDLIHDRLAGQALQGPGNPLVMLALALLLTGLGVLLGTMPFHTWIHAALAQAQPIEGYLVVALAPQLALAVLTHLSTGWPVEATELALLVASASVAYGYARALHASGVPEVLAGLTTGQAGLLLGHAFFAHDAGQSMAHYALGNYLLNATCLWAVSSQLPQVPSDSRRVLPFAGVARRTPRLGAALTVCLLNVAGLYPLAGGYVQIAFLRAAISTGHSAGAILAVTGTALAWLIAGKLSLQAWAGQEEKESGPAPSPEVTVAAWGAAAAMLVAGLNAAGVWRWLAVLASGS